MCATSLLGKVRAWGCDIPIAPESQTFSPGWRIKNHQCLCFVLLCGCCGVWVYVCFQRILGIGEGFVALNPRQEQKVRKRFQATAENWELETRNQRDSLRQESRGALRGSVHWREPRSVPG